MHAARHVNQRKEMPKWLRHLEAFYGNALPGLQPENDQRRGCTKSKGQKRKKEKERKSYCTVYSLSLSLIFCVCMRERVEWAIQAKPCYVLDEGGLSVEGPYGP